MAGDEQQEFVLITRALELSGLVDKFLEFQEYCLVDALVKGILSDLKNSGSVLADIITDEEDRKRFAEAFTKLCGEEQEQNTEKVMRISTEEETGAQNVVDSLITLESHLQTVSSTSRGAQEQNSSRSKQGKSVWAEISESHGLKVGTEFGVKRKLKERALEIQKQFYEASFKNHLKDVQAQELPEMAEKAAFEFMENAMRLVEDRTRTLELEKLKEELDKQGRALTEELFGKQQAAQKQIFDDMNAICIKYEALWSEEAGQEILSAEECKDVDDFVTGKLLDDFNRQYGTNTLYSEEDFRKCIDLQRDKFLTPVSSNDDEIQRKTAELVEQLTSRYHERFEKMPNISLFDATHQEVIDSLKTYVLEYEHLDKDNRKVSWETFLATLDDARKQAEVELLKRESESQKDQTTQRQQLIEAYRKKTDPAFNNNIPVAEAVLQTLHENIKGEVLSKMVTGKRTMSAADKEIQQKQFEQDVDLILSEALERNKACWAAFLKDAEALNEGIIDDYVDCMCETETIHNEDEWNTKEECTRQKFLKKFETKLGSRVRDNKYVESATGKMKNLLISEREECWKVFRDQLKERKLLHKAGMTETKKYYIEEMELSFYSKEWWNEPELREVHEEILGHALEACRDSLDLSVAVEQSLRSGFEVIFQRYLEKNKLRTPNREPAIGIDLGTTYSCVAVHHKDTIQVIPNTLHDGKSTVASYVAFDEAGKILIGNEAKERAFRNPTNTIFDAKRLIGRKFDDPQVQEDIRLWPFEVISQYNQPTIKVKGQTYRPEEISAKILAYLKKIAEKHLDRTVRKAVITVPAYFNDAQRKATKDAAEIAGLEASIINEPTAAALAYQLHNTGDATKNVLVFDLGGGTFDVVVISMGFGKDNVIAVNGDTHLGGEDFDNAMVDALVDRVKKKFNIDLSRGRNSSNVAEKLDACRRLRRLKSACEEQKRLLSETKKVEIQISLLDGDFSLKEPFTRDEFNAINEERFQRCIKVVEKALKDAKLDRTEVDDVVLVGGSTRIPKVQEMLKEYFGEQQSFCRRINADEAVAYGAAYRAALIYGDKKKDELLKDITPFSLGVEILGGGFSVIIAKHTSLPCTKNSNYCTSSDNQTEVSFKIFEGEDTVAVKNNRLGEFQLTGIPRNAAGEEKMNCIMTIDSEGILHVEATSSSSGRTQKIAITEHSGRMSKQEITTAKQKPVFRWM